MTMRLITVVALAVGSFAVAHADPFPVVGTVSGSFATPSGNQNGGLATTTTTNDTWLFDNGTNTTKILYSAGPSFNSSVPPSVDISLGSLTMTVMGNGGIGAGQAPTDNLLISVNFTTPTGIASFIDPLSLSIDNGSSGFRILLTGIPGPQTFTAVGVAYTVTFDGMFNSLAAGGTDITKTGLQVDTGSNTGTAYLKGTISAAGSTLPAIPEPGSLGLLLTAIGGLAFSLYRKRLV